MYIALHKQLDTGTIVKDRYQCIPGTALLLASLSNPANAATDLQYDAREQYRQSMFNQMVMKTRICMHDGISTMLQMGARDSAVILKNLETLCGTPLIANRKVIAPDVTEADLRIMLKGYAIKELGSVPGLSPIVPIMPLLPQINWDQQQVTLRGVVRKSSFEECCFEGEARQSDYYYLALKDKIDIVTKNTHELAMPNLDSIQLGGQPGALREGQSVTVTCKEIRYGNNGHYAMSAYCADPKIKR